MLALGDLDTGDDNPCLKLAKGGGAKKPAPKTAGQPPAEKVTEAVKAPLDALKKGLGGLFGKKN
ncbi:MAG: hypothetical protein CMM23_01580 [Rhodospirillaceae bacterium]|nr:hypothetical protein [Rhodospirillaceae bacterium]MEE1555703.1 hypothetical protein [Alphaproteobacteria bacterium]